MEIKRNYKKWLNAVTEPDLRNKLLFLSEEEIHDAFYRELEFGTGGLRGIMDVGTNRMNTYTVNKATQGLCDFLKGQQRLSSVAIAYDSRINSEQFAKSAAEVIAGNGAKAYLFAELMPTPVLSYAVRALGCDAGIVITASHNPAKYNGYKVYGSDGCQITLQAAESIQNSIEKVDIFSDVKKEPFENAVQKGDVRFISPDVYESYLDQAENCSLDPGILEESDLKVIYTPLNGTGNKPVRELLTRAGLKNLTIVPEQEKPDGLFPTCQKPNPEEPDAYKMAINLAGKLKADLLIATDPDCDRVGIAVECGKRYILLTGNGRDVCFSIISYRRKKPGTLPENPVIIKTIVTSAMANMIAEEYGVRVIDTLTGFKFIGEQIGLLERNHEEGSYVFGFEESYGYLPEVFVRDKDAVSTSLLICEMAAFYKKNGSTLLEELEKLYTKHGYWKHKLLSFTLEGADGIKKIEALMHCFRKGHFMEYAKMPVIKTDDYLSSVSSNKATGVKTSLLLPKSDVIAFSFENNCKFVLRPSGTEPKVKFYLTVRSDDSDCAMRMLTSLEADLTAKINLF